MITDKFKQLNWSNGFEASNSVYARKNMEVKHYQGDREREPLSSSLKNKVKIPLSYRFHDIRQFLLALLGRL